LLTAQVTDSSAACLSPSASSKKSVFFLIPLIPKRVLAQDMCRYGSNWQRKPMMYLAQTPEIAQKATNTPIERVHGFFST
jgi:hypothetical protein